MFSGYKYSDWDGMVDFCLRSTSPIYLHFGQGLPTLYTDQAPFYVWCYRLCLDALAIYIGTKPKWIDRLIGLPMAYMIHGILSLVAIILAFLHKEGSPSQG
jgi:predicted ferric reductase